MAQVIRSGQRTGSATVAEERDDGTIVVEGDTAEEAVHLARERFGPDAEIVEVHRVERGGLRGFFARELFQVIAGPSAMAPPRTKPAPRAAPPVGARPEVDALVRQIGQVGATSPDPTSPAPPDGPGDPEPSGGIGRALGQVETEEEAFGSMLRRELHARGLAASTSETIDLTDPPSASGSAPVPVGPAAARPLRPVAAPTPVPPAPVPPAEPFRIDDPASPFDQGPPERSVAPLPVMPAPTAERARSALKEAVVVESQAQVRPPRGAPTAPVATSVTAAAVVEEQAEVGGQVIEGQAAAPVVEERAEVGGQVIEGQAAAAVVEERAEAPVPAVEESTVAPEGTALEVASTAVVGRTDPCSHPDTPPGLGSVRWSVDRLAHLGLPFALVQRTVGLDPADDQRWLLTLAAGLADFVRPEPRGSAVFAGPRADRIGTAMDLPVVEAPELPPYGGSVALKTTDDGAGRAWLARVRGDRVLHVVVGGRGWELLLAKDPDAVVVSAGDSVLTGLQVAVEHEVPISYVADVDGLRRADALDLAIAIRSLLGRW